MVSQADLAIMRRLDRLHLEVPFAGSRMLRGLFVNRRDLGTPPGSIKSNTCRADRRRNPAPINTSAHRDIYSEHKDQYGPWFGAMLERIMNSPPETDEEMQEREEFKRSFLALFHQVDAVLLPVMPVVLPTVDKIDAYFQSGPRAIGRFSALVNVAGVPSLTLPCGFSPDRSPIGFQIIGRALSEPLMLRVGHCFQTHTAWHQTRPIT